MEVGPGDVIYTPPFFWHHVETLGEEPDRKGDGLVNKAVMWSAGKGWLQELGG